MIQCLLFIFILVVQANLQGNPSLKEKKHSSKVVKVGGHPKKLVSHGM
jgi:hypothetical protein